MIQQPPFWLEVRKEYIIDNYGGMLNYLRSYQYDIAHETDNSDYNKTFACLKDVVADIRAEMSADTVYRHVAEKWDNAKQKLNIGLIATYLLAAQKKGSSDDGALADLCRILLSLEKHPMQDLLSNMMKVFCGCACRKQVAAYGFTWDDILALNEYPSVSLFCQKTSNTSFISPDEEKVYYYEGKGLLTINADKVQLAPMNLFEFQRSELISQFNTAVGLDVLSSRQQHTGKTEFPEIIETCSNILKGLDGVKPSPKLRNKEFTEGEIVKVRLTDVNVQLGFIDCETVSAEHDRVKGRLYIPNKLYSIKNSFTIDRESFIKHMSKGDIIDVRLQSRGGYYPFAIGADRFVEFAGQLAQDIQYKDCDAVYIGKNAKGDARQWLTKYGLKVNIFTEPTDEDTFSAIENRTPEHIRIKNATQDNHGNWVVNGEYLSDGTPDADCSFGEFMDACRTSFIRSFADYCYVEVDDSKTDIQTVLISTDSLPLLMDIVYDSSLMLTDTNRRYATLFADCFVARLAGQEESEPYIRHQMEYMECLAHFSLGDVTASTLSLDADYTPDDGGTLAEERRVIECLSKYRDLGHSHYSLVRDSKIDLDYLREMIDAANVLRDKLEPDEINRIKKSIANYIGVADIYLDITSKKKFYGEETERVELKSSIVYPPDNNMKPDLNRQKWAVMKAVCAFLNSETGGEVLLGVNNGGVACGLQDDITYLYTRKYIGFETLDSYRLYVKNILDKAFTDDMGNEGQLIAATHISYDPFRDEDGYDILRIKVKPYERGIVSFRDDHIPYGLSRSFLRTSGASTPMDKSLIRQIKELKKLK